jgi:hypothetical protein
MLSASSSRRRPASGADPQDQLDRFGRLDGADDPRQHAKHSTFRAARHEARRRWFGIETAIAGPAPGREDRGLPVEAEDAAVCVRLAEEHARVVDEIPCREIVGAVDDDVVVAKNVERVGGRQRRLVHDHAHFRIEPGEPCRRRLHLGAPDVGRAEEDLPLKVAGVHHVEVDEPERADAGRGQVEGRGRSKPARADANHARVLQFLLTLDADFRNDQVTAVALNFIVGQRRGSRSPRHRGNDADRVGRSDRRVFALQLTDVVVVDVDVHEAPERSLRGEQVLAKIRMRRRQRAQELADGGAFGRDDALLARERAQGSGNENANRHRLCLLASPKPRRRRA